jgi:NitT/TauT family transport system substrate-binding protein
MRTAFAHLPRHSSRRPVGRHRHARRGSGAMALAALLFLTACGGGSDSETTAGQAASADEVSTVRVGYIPIVSTLATVIGVDEGIYEEHGLQAELTKATSGAELVAALQGGSLDIGYSNYSSIFQAVDQNLDIMMIASSDGDAARPGPDGAMVGISSVLVLEDSPFKGGSDLRGKKVAVNGLRNINELALRMWLADSGVDIEEVTLVELAFPAQGPALRSGAIDAAFVTEPFVTQELKQGGVRGLGDAFAAINPDLPLAAWITTREFAEKNPEIIENFQRATFLSAERTNAMTDEEKAEMLAKHLSIAPEVGIDVVLGHFHEGFPLDDVQGIADVMYDNQLISRKLDVSDLTVPDPK